MHPYTAPLDMPAFVQWTPSPTTTSNSCPPIGCQLPPLLPPYTSSHIVAGSATFCPLSLLALIVVLFLSWALSGPAVFNNRKGPRASPSSLVDGGGVSAHPSTIVIPMSLSFPISHLCMSLSLPCPFPSFPPASLSPVDVITLAPVI